MFQDCLAFMGPPSFHGPLGHTFGSPKAVNLPWPIFMPDIVTFVKDCCFRNQLMGCV